MTAVKVNLSDLDRMSREELEQLRNRIAFRLDAGSSAEVMREARSADLILVQNEMCGALQKAGYPKAIPLDAMLSGKVGSILKAGSRILMAYAREHFRTSHRAEEVKAVRWLLGRIVAHQRRYNSYPTTPKTVCQDMKKIAKIIESSFPCYAASGLLPLLLTKSASGIKGS